MCNSHYLHWGRLHLGNHRPIHLPPHPLRPLGVREDSLVLELRTMPGKFLYKEKLLKQAHIYLPRIKMTVTFETED